MVLAIEVVVPAPTSVNLSGETKLRFTVATSDTETHNFLADLPSKVSLDIYQGCKEAIDDAIQDALAAHVGT